MSVLIERRFFESLVLSIDSSPVFARHAVNLTVDHLDRLGSIARVDCVLSVAPPVLKILAAQKLFMEDTLRISLRRVGAKRRQWHRNVRLRCALIRPLLTCSKYIPGWQLGSKVQEAGRRNETEHLFVARLALEKDFLGDRARVPMDATWRDQTSLLRSCQIYLSRQV